MHAAVHRSMAPNIELLPGRQEQNRVKRVHRVLRVLGLHADYVSTVINGKQGLVSSFMHQLLQCTRVVLEVAGRH
eukprot:SAG11_NODE_644_length_7980_cov_112.535963_4_plen_75_part_00